MVIIFIVIVHNPIANNFIVVAILGSLFPMEIYTCSTLIDYFNSYSTIKKYSFKNKSNMLIKILRCNNLSIT